jgi:hypothetical protein
MVFRNDNLAFGIATLHLLWAIEQISLGDIPWDRAMIEAIQSDNRVKGALLRPNQKKP